MLDKSYFVHIDIVYNFRGNRAYCLRSRHNQLEYLPPLPRAQLRSLFRFSMIASRARQTIVFCRYLRAVRRMRVQAPRRASAH